MAIFDISQLSESNPWWIDKKNINSDIKIVTLNKMEYKWDPALRHYINLDKDILLTIRGPRQVGKTTLMKLMIRDFLLNKSIKPENIFFFSFESNSPEELKQIVQTYLDWRTNNPDERKYLFLDEICAVKEWSKILSFFANKGAFVNCSVVVTGSHSMDIKHSTELMPGRRGGDDSNPLDRILLPMKFAEYVSLVDPSFKKILFDLNLVKKDDRQKKMMELFEGKIDSSLEKLSMYKKRLDSLLESYLLTGGIPATINEYKKTGKISTNLFNVYISFIIGDLHRYGYKEHYFKQIMREIFNALSNPISWNQFTKNTDIGSHNTVQDYMTAMEELYVANISFRCTIHNQKSSPFMKKIYLLDPFFFHALHGWSHAKKDYFVNAKSNLMDIEMKSKIVESVVYNHLCRFSYGLNPRDFFDPKDSICYYRDKKNKEVDFIMMFDEKMYPFEVKYQATISNPDFVAFSSFKKGVLITKDHLGIHGNYVQVPISLFLMMV